MNCCTKFQLYYISGWPSTVYSLAGLLALCDIENIVKYIKHISKQEIYFTEKKINMHVYFIY
jgi:hypothetical protein